MKKIAIISLSDLSRDPRVFRQILAFKERYDLITAGLVPSEFEEIPFFKLHYYGERIYQRALPMIISRKFDEFYWNYSNFKELGYFLHKYKPDIIIANDIEMLPIALKYKANAKIIFDAHEYAPLEFEDSFLFNLFFKKYKTYLVKNYVPHVDKMITVSKGIADKYQKDTGVTPVVITNAPKYESIKPNVVNPKKIRLVHHGVAHPSRNIELHFKIMKYLNPSIYEFHFYLVSTDEGYLKKIMSLASISNNIFIHKPVQMNLLSNCISQYDMGVYLLMDNNFNNQYALPNKFFEFIQGRLAVIIGPSPEMASYVNEYSLGVVCPNFHPKNVAAAISELTPEKIMEYKNNSNSAAIILSFEENKKILNQIVQDLIIAR